MVDSAAEVQLSRPNLHYYFSTTSELYSVVIFDSLAVWNQGGLCFEMFAELRVALNR